MSSGFESGETTDILVKGPDYSLLINNSQRKDVLPVSLKLTEGLAPGELILNIPDAEFNTNQIKKGDFVKFKVWRKGSSNYSHRFLGQVTSIQDTYSFNPGPTITCLDFRHFLTRDVCWRNYNVPNHYKPQSTLEPGGPKNVEQIIEDIIVTWKARNSELNPEYSQLLFNSLGIPISQPVGELSCLGQTIASVLENLIDEYTHGECLWILDYLNDWTPVIRVVHANTQSIGRKDFFYGTDPTVVITEQPIQETNTNQVTSNEDISALETRVVVLGENRKVQKLIPLQPDWAFRDNPKSALIEGHFSDSIPNPNPDKLTQLEIIALHLTDETIFTEMGIGLATASRVQNPNYNPDMGFIGRKYKLAPLLMFDPAKNSDQAWCDLLENEGYNVGLPDEVTLTSDIRAHMSFQIPRIEDSLFTLPLPVSEYNSTENSYGDAQYNSPVYVMARFNSDLVYIQRIKIFKDIWDVDPFDPNLLWTVVKQGVSTHKSNVVLEKTLYKISCLGDFLLRSMPSTTAFADMGTVGDAFNQRGQIKPCILDIIEDGTPALWDDVGGLVDWQFGFQEVITLVDTIFGYTGSGTGPDSDHLLRWLALSPDWWGPDYATPGVAALKKNTGIWRRVHELCYPTTGENVGKSGLFVRSIDTAYTVAEDHTLFTGPRPPAPEGFFYLDSSKLYEFRFFEFPVQVFLNAVVCDTRRVRIDTGDLNPNSKIKRTVIYENNDFKYLALGKGALYDVDYRKEYQAKGILPDDADKIAALSDLPEEGVSTTTVYLDRTNPAYSLGYVLKNDQASVKQGSPPLGVLHLDESDADYGGDNDPKKSKMGIFALSKTGKTANKVQKFQIVVDAMEFVANIGFDVFINYANMPNEKLRVTEITHTFFGGSPQNANTTELVVTSISSLLG